MKYSLVACIGAAALLTGLPSQAQDKIEWSGFGNIAAGMTTGSDDQLFGYDNDLDFNPDTLFALQAKADISDKLTVTTQLMSRGSDDFDLGVEWAYLQYQLTDSTSINMGKLRLPLYMYSDSLDIGYSYHWLRTPESVYRVPFDNYTGVNLQHNAFVGNFIFNTQVIAGNVNDEIEAAGTETDAEINNLIGLNTSASYSNLTIRLAYYQSNDANIELRGVSDDIDGLLATLEAIGANQIVSELDVAEDDGTFTGFGVMYDNFDWFVGAEYTELEVENSYIPKQRSSYITAGKRFSDWMLHATFGRTDDKVIDQERFNIGNPQLQQGILMAATTQLSEVDYKSVGARFSIASGAALKFDVTHSDDKRTDESDVLVSAAVQFVF